MGEELVALVLLLENRKLGSDRVRNSLKVTQQMSEPSTHPVVPLSGSVPYSA